jgi:hypothetical protein
MGKLIGVDLCKGRHGKQLDHSIVNGRRQGSSYHSFPYCKIQRRLLDTSFRRFIRDFVAFDAQLTQSIEDNYRYIGEPNRNELYVRFIMCHYIYFSKHDSRTESDYFTSSFYRTL